MKKKKIIIKKILYPTAVSLLTLSLLLSGCSQSEENIPITSAETSVTIAQQESTTVQSETQSTSEAAQQVSSSQSTLYVNELGNKDVDTSYDLSSDSVISFDDDSISGTGSGYTISGTTLTITEKGTYILTGTLTDGNIIVEANDEEKVHLVFLDCHITSSTTAPLYIISGDKVIITLADGTDNSCTDSSSYVYASAEESNPDSTIYSKSDLTINGTGSLTINANYKDGIVSKDDLVIVSGTIVVNAVNNAIKGKDSVTIADGNFSINCQGKGIISDNTEDIEKGYVNISGGTFFIQSEDDAIHSNNAVIINGGTYEIYSGDDGIHADGELTINGGNIEIAKSYEGLEAAIITINDGEINLTSSDDGFNAADSTESESSFWGFGGGGWGGMDAASDNCYIYFNGGTTYINAGGDGVDSNGCIVMTGGTVYIDGPSDSANGATDYAGTFTFSGGTYIAAGSSGMVQNISTATNGGSVLVYTGSQTAGSTFTLLDSSGNIVLEYTPAKTYQCILIGSEALTLNKTYTVQIDGTELGSFTQSSTITTASLGSSTGGFGGMGGSMDNGNRPGGNGPGGRR